MWLAVAADELKEGVKGAADKTKDMASGISADGLLKADAWQLIVGLLLTTVVFAVINAAGRSDNVDRFTSDGTTLEFGQRAQQRENPYSAYQPAYGQQ